MGRTRARVYAGLTLQGVVAYDRVRSLAARAGGLPIQR